MDNLNTFVIERVGSPKGIVVTAEKFEISDFGKHAIFKNGKEIVGYYDLSGVRSIIKSNSSKPKGYKSRFGSVFNTPGVKQMTSSGPYKGYAHGVHPHD